jgi:hypothetical protein
MASKREERKQRSEAERQARQQRKRAQGMRSRVLIVIGVLTVGGAIILGVTRRRDSGRVWSAEHGHWHER